MLELFSAPLFEDAEVQRRRRQRAVQPGLTLISFPEVFQLIH